MAKRILWRNLLTKAHVLKIRKDKMLPAHIKKPRHKHQINVHKMLENGLFGKEILQTDSNAETQTFTTSNKRKIQKLNKISGEKVEEAQAAIETRMKLLTKYFEFKVCKQ
jgi:hypothetical protein